MESISDPIPSPPTNPTQGWLQEPPHPQLLIWGPSYNQTRNACLEITPPTIIRCEDCPCYLGGGQSRVGAEGHVGILLLFVFVFGELLYVLHMGVCVAVSVPTVSQLLLG